MKNTPIVQLTRRTKSIPIIALFILAFLFPLYSSNTQCEWTGIQKIVAVGDLHGDYKSFVDILKATGLVELVNKEPHWIGGKTHLVQIGDVMDRGDYAKDIFDFLMRLEKEAEQAGGKVHFLLGNHEEMNITGIAFDNENYVTLGQFLSFLPDEYKADQERKFRKKIGNNIPTERGSDSSLDSNLKPYWEKILSEARKNQNHPARIMYQKSFNEKYGKWIVQHNAVIKIDDIIFVHGGINDSYSKRKLENINNRLRQELNSFIMGNPIEDIQIVYDRNGPLWNRDLALPGIKEQDLKSGVDKILQNLGARYMVLAHTAHLKTTRADMTRFDGRIWVIDTGISYVYRQSGGLETALIIEETGNDIKFSVWPFDFNKESKQPIEQTRYLQEWMATKAFELPEFIGGILRDALRTEIFIGGNNEN